jgi:hypothetical protein
VLIKVDASDATIHGALQGRLQNVSSDTLTEQSPSGTSQTFYRARVSFDPLLAR